MRSLPKDFGSKIRLALDTVWGLVDFKSFDVEIKNTKTQKIVFKQDNVQFPEDWEYNDVVIVTSRYFRGHVGDANRESSLRHLIDRVVLCVTKMGYKDKYLKTMKEATKFAVKLAIIMKDRKACFNSPVLFNFGWHENPQASACFLLEVEDTIESLCGQHQVTEAKLFKGGSGAGVNVGNVRSSYEKLSKGGYSSGPLGFMKGWDMHAGALKSGGVCLDQNQKVLTDKGPVKVSLLLEVPFKVLSYQPSLSKLVFKTATAKYSGIKEVFRIHTDLGTFDLSYDHPVRLLDGTYRQTKGLEPEDKIHSCSILFKTKDKRITVLSKLDFVDFEGAELKIRKYVCELLSNEFHKSLYIESRGKQKVYDVEVQCETLDNKSKESGHNFVIWPYAGLEFYNFSLGVFEKDVVEKCIIVSNTRRAAKMVSMDDTHPDLLEQRDGSEGFIKVKVLEGYKAKVLQALEDTSIKKKLINKGLSFLKDHSFDATFDGEVLHNLQHQNANYSIWMSDAFMLSLKASLSEDEKGSAKYVVVLKDKTSFLYDPRTHLKVASDFYFKFDEREERWVQIEKDQSKEIKEVNDIPWRTIPIGKWRTYAITTGKQVHEYDIQDLMKEICKATWECGDPGLQFDGTINKYNSLLDMARITRSNPCSEYISISKDVDPKKTIIVDKAAPLAEQPAAILRDRGSSCNLASLNLLKYFKKVKNLVYDFDKALFKEDVFILIKAMDIICGNASYPTSSIGRMSKRYRELGLGYTNLGATLMWLGIPYDSEEGLLVCKAITAYLNATSREASSHLAKVKGTFEGYNATKKSMKRVNKLFLENVELTRIETKKHRSHYIYGILNDSYSILKKLDQEDVPLRNSKLTLLAPTGTISFMMGAETTGIEAELALVKVKTLSGGGFLEQTNTGFVRSLKNLGYSKEQQSQAIDFVKKNGTIHGCPNIKEKHWKIYQTSFDPRQPLSYKAHVNMMAAAQLYLDGAISKTVNVPKDFTPEDIQKTFMYAYEQGIKCIAIFRDGCKEQPVKSKGTIEEATLEEFHSAPVKIVKNTREAIIHSVKLNGVSFHITFGFFEDGSVCEVFINMDHGGSTLAGLLKCFSIAVSLGIRNARDPQVLLDKFKRKFKNNAFEPAGPTDDPEIRTTHSIADYIFRKIDHIQKGKPVYQGLKIKVAENSTKQYVTKDGQAVKIQHMTGECCVLCGGLTKQAGACQVCIVCGHSQSCG